MANAATLPLLLKELRLPTMARLYQPLQTRALEHHWPRRCRLRARAAERERRRLSATSGCPPPPGKTLQHFDFTASAGLKRQQLVQLTEDATWVERTENLLLFGPSGVGKPISPRPLATGSSPRGASALRLGNRSGPGLQTAKQALRLSDALAKLDKYPLLVLDDIGYVKRTEMESSVLFELIAHRYESGSLLITSNHPFSEWDAIFPDNMMAVAAIDRLVHHAHIIELNGQSYRKRQATRNQEVSNKS
jgi:DNA replication protein DnaC